MGKPVVALAFRTDGTRLDIGGAHTRPGQEQLVGRFQGKPMATALRLEGLASVSPCYLAPGVGDVVTYVVAAAPNCRTENDVNVVGPRTKGGGHDSKRCTNNICDGSPPSGVSNPDSGAAPPGSRIDDQHGLAVGVQGHQHRADLVRHQCIAEPDLHRSRSRAVPGMGFRGDPDVPSVNLTQGNKMLGYKTQRGAPMLAHRPGVVPITRCTEPNVAIGTAQTLDASGYPMCHTRDGCEQLALPGATEGRSRAPQHSARFVHLVISLAASKII